MNTLSQIYDALKKVNVKPPYVRLAICLWIGKSSRTVSISIYTPCNHLSHNHITSSLFTLPSHPNPHPHTLTHTLTPSHPHTLTPFHPHTSIPLHPHTLTSTLTPSHPPSLPHPHTPPHPHTLTPSLPPHIQVLDGA